MHSDPPAGVGLPPHKLTWEPEQSVQLCRRRRHRRLLPELQSCQVYGTAATCGVHSRRNLSAKIQEVTRAHAEKCSEAERTGSEAEALPPETGRDRCWALFDLSPGAPG